MDEGALYHDRSQAGAKLAQSLERYRDAGVLVLGIPRGGVPVAAEVARYLHAELDIVVARKLGAPGQPELALGAVTANGGRFLNEEIIRELAASHEYVEAETERKTTEARAREKYMRQARPPASIAGRTVIIVDDGLATGATMRAAVRSVRKAQPTHLIVAAPVGARESCDAIRDEADEVVCPLQPEPFFAVGLYYRRFEPVSEEEVRRLLSAASVVPQLSSADGPPQTTAAREQEVWFRNASGARLAASLVLPEGIERPPVVVFAHGFGSSRHSSRNRAIAERLSANGIASLLFDFTGHGDSQGSEQEATIPQMVQDLTAAIDVLNRRPDVDPGRIGVSGSSSGGIVTTLVAARDPRVQAAVLRSVAAEGLFDDASRIHAPTLVIAGEDDIPIVEEDRALADALGGEHRFVTIAGAGHLFEGPGQQEEVAEHSASWFAEKLRAPVGA